jgi:hypothetical protein
MFLIKILQGKITNSRLRFNLLTVLLIFIIIILIKYLRIINYEGFNPSDDGVVLAQAFRIFNGEIWHNDFISIRPVFSGMLHSIYFYLNLPIETTARWFVVFEYLIISLLWTRLLFKNFFNENLSYQRDFLSFASCFLTCFVLNLSYGTYYPWTTIDSILFFTIGVSFLFKSYHRNKCSLIALSFIFFSIASLCRQTFLIAEGIISGYLIWESLKCKKIIKVSLFMIIGGLPFYFYLAYLIHFKSLNYFLIEISGRNDFVQTAILRFPKSFLKAKLVLPNLLILFTIFLSFLRGRNSLFHSFIARNLRIIIILYFFVIIICGILQLILKDDNSMLMPYEILWAVVIVWVLVIHSREFNIFQNKLVFFILLLAWISSISAGLNSPVLVLGICMLLGIAIIINQIQHLPLLRIILPFVSFLYLILFLVFQNQNNYRDLPCNKLKYSLNDISGNFGNIYTNKTTFEYFKELLELIEQNHLQNRFVTIPNSSIVYPILKSKNPFPLDWMQSAEYAGSERLLKSKILEAISKDTVFLIIDKYDSKQMATGLKYKTLVTENLIVNSEFVKDYSYLTWLQPYMKASNKNYKYFEVFICKK